MMFERNLEISVTNANKTFAKQNIDVSKAVSPRAQLCASHQIKEFLRRRECWPEEQG